jgi:hypothetical protein
MRSPIRSGDARNSIDSIGRCLERQHVERAEHGLVLIAEAIARLLTVGRRSMLFARFA